MYWFRRPPYLRWTAAALIVVTALWMDLRGEPTEQRPFALAAIEAGTLIDANMIEYRPVPTGILPKVDLDGFAISSIAPGEPITPALLTDRGAVPDGWWALEMVVPSGAVPGTELRLVVDGVVVPAMVAGVVPPDPQTGWSDGTTLVAVPADSAAVVATALAEDRISVLVVEW